MKTISAGIQRPAVIILALTWFLMWSAFQALAQDKSRASVQKVLVQKASVQKGNDHTFSHDVNAETIQFEAVNPVTQVAGRMTVTITGAVRGNRLWDGQSAVGSHLQGETHAAFSFVPYYPLAPSYSATIGRLQVAGDTTNDSIFLDFGLKATGSDGSVQWFMLREVVTATEHGAQIAFQQLKLPEKLIAQPDTPCGSVLN
jgi:hypothetical protein